MLLRDVAAPKAARDDGSPATHCEDAVDCQSGVAGPGSRVADRASDDRISAGGASLERFDVGRA